MLLSKKREEVKNNLLDAENYLYEAWKLVYKARSLIAISDSASSIALGNDLSKAIQLLENAEDFIYSQNVKSKILFQDETEQSKPTIQ